MQNHKKVIPFTKPDQTFWTFCDFVHPNSNNPVESWYWGLSDEGRLLFDGLLKANYKTELPIHWIGLKRFLKGEARAQQIWELQFFDKSQKRTYRVLGTFGSVRKQAVILIGCYHKGSVYDPPQCIDTAVARAKMLARKEAKLVERKIRTDI